MLEAKLVYSGVQGLFRVDGKSPTYTGPLPEDTPIRLEELARGANYVVIKKILRQGLDIGEIFSAANEPSPTLSVNFQLLWDSLDIVRYFMDFYDEFITNFFVKPRKEPEGLHLYGLPRHFASFIPEDPKEKAFRDRLLSCGEAPVIINESVLDNIYKFEEFRKLMRSGSFKSPHFFEIWSDSLGRLGFSAENDGYMAHLISGLNITPILQQILGPANLSREETAQFIKFVEKMVSREGLQLGSIHKN